MKNKSSVLIIIAFLLVYFILEGIFGTHGLMVNRELERTLEVRNRERDATALEIQSLQELFERSYGKDVLLDNAITIGKTAKGDTVYYFSSPDTFEPQKVVDTDSDNTKSYKGVASLALMTIAFATVIVIIVLAVILKSIKRRNTDEDEDNQL